MPFLPVRSYLLKSFAKPSEIVAVLKMHVQPFSIVNRFDGHKPFSGSVSEYSFQFIRTGAIGNFFRPAVSGVLQLSPQFTVIRITIQHDTYFFIPSAIIFLLFCLFSVSSSALPLLVAFFSKNFQGMQKYLSLPYLLLLLSPIAILAICYILAWAAFDSEAKRLESELAKILAPLVVGPLE